MTSFPSAEWFQKYAAFVETDEDVRKHGRWFKASIGFRVDQHVTTVNFDRGLILDVVPQYRDADFLISGSAPQWSRLFDDQWGLVRLYRSQTLLIRGDAVRLMKEWKPIFFLVEAMKRLGRSS